MAKQFNEGKQAMVIYPLVEESEKSDLSAAIQAHENFKNKIFKTFKVGLVHGRMDSIEKDLIMEKFSKNLINLLVSTKVIEDGVDILKNFDSPHEWINLVALKHTSGNSRRMAQKLLEDILYKKELRMPRYVSMLNFDQLHKSIDN